jgi:hypothetical protein
MNAPMMSMEQIRISGLTALLNELGPVGTIRFLQQFETGYGDYSKERHEWLDSWDVDTLIEKIRQKQRNQGAR